MLSSVTLALCLLSAENPFQSQVRPTDPLTPDQQRLALHVPSGFEVQLFASEPDLQKPMNMAFDAAGRLWVSGSVEYPFAAVEGNGRDTIKVLEDTDGDGRADKVTTFADGLNIPIGLYPYGNGVITYSIPNLWFLQDTDGDGRADRRDVLYGPLGNPRDTHGMQNAMRRGFDGWLYICHGFANESVIRGRDGSSITLQSGNTYRVRVDGSHVEQFTWGQVNPFGSVFTELGDLITADCHSNPLTLLLRGGYYSSFGKPHDGLGFIAPIMNHSHGSTAIAGAAYCSGEGFPEEYRGSVFLGNVMTSRVHRDKLVYHGSTAEARESEDFVVSDDPWFRPVDVQFGPDGALYVADFYNRIIGHYEVPLNHPGRDRDRARIWRIRYVGEKPTTSSRRDLAKADLPSLLKHLSDSNLTFRSLATDQISDRFGAESAEDVRGVIRANVNPDSLIQAAWVLSRWNQLKMTDLEPLATHADAKVRTHAMRMLAETSEWSEAHVELAVQGLMDTDPFVVRAAADAFGQHAESARVNELLGALAKVPADDSHLRQTLRIAIRNQLRVPGRLAELAESLKPRQRRVIASLALGLPTEDAGAFLLAELRAGRVESGEQQAALAHVARNTPVNEIEQIVTLAQSLVNEDPDMQLELLGAMNLALVRRGVAPPDSFRDWGVRLFGKLLGNGEPSTQWTNVGAENPWGLEPRQSADGKKQIPFLSSLPGGEQKTGVLKSQNFAIPAELTFYVCGHLGYPQNPARPDNFVQLRLVDDRRVIAQAIPPRNDTAQKVTWKLADYAGKMGYLEVVDGIDLDAYAWLAVARFDPPVVGLPSASPQQLARRKEAAAQLAEDLKLTQVAPDLRKMALEPSSDPAVAAAAVRAWATLRDDRVGRALAEVLGEPSVASELRNQLARALCDGTPDEVNGAAQESLRTAPARLQATVALKLSESPSGAEVLLTLVSQGRIARRLLQPEGMRQRLLAANPKQVAERLASLTEGLPTETDRIDALVKERRDGLGRAETSAERGKAVFTKHCVACHQIQGQGAVVGPQLDGIGTRGTERIVEDVLDPNRNVDAAFHTVVLTLSDGRVVIGLPRRDEGQASILVNNEGKEFSILRSEIDEQRRLPNSLMPANFGELIPANEFYDLIAFLAAQRQAVVPSPKASPNVP